MSQAIAATHLLLLLQEIKRKVRSFRDRERLYRKLANLDTTLPKTREEFEMRAFDFNVVCNELETILPPDTNQKNDDANSTTVTVHIGTAAEVSGGACVDSMCGSEYCPRCS